MQDTSATGELRTLCVSPRKRAVNEPCVGATKAGLRAVVLSRARQRTRFKDSPRQAGIYMYVVINLTLSVEEDKQEAAGEGRERPRGLSFKCVLCRWALQMRADQVDQGRWGIRIARRSLVEEKEEGCSKH